jgi:hypothetical protein
VHTKPAQKLDQFLSSGQWVGTGRTAFPVFSRPPRCHRACGFHRTRRPHERIYDVLGSTASEVDSHFPGALRGTPRCSTSFVYLSRCSPSPCRRLSRPPSTMATLTPSRRIGGFQNCFQPITSALLTIVRRVSRVHCHGLPRDHLGGGYPSTYTCIPQASPLIGGKQVRPYPSSAGCAKYPALRGGIRGRCMSPKRTGPSGKVLSQGPLSP